MYDTSLKFCNYEGKATFFKGKFFFIQHKWEDLKRAPNIQGQTEGH